MLTVSFGSRDIMNYEFLPTWAQKHEFFSILRCLHKAIIKTDQNSRQINYGHFHHANESSHSSNINLEFLKTNSRNTNVNTNVPYLTVVAPYDIFLFSLFKPLLRGPGFGLCAISYNSLRVQKGFHENDFKERFEHLKEHWQIIALQSEYITLKEM